MFGKRRRPLQDTPIRFKLLFGYLTIFLLALGSSGAFLYSAIHSTLETNIEKQLQTSTQLILNMVETSIDASIKNHLRAIAETNERIVRYHWHQWQKGRVSETEAKAQAAQALLSQCIGRTGYIYVIDSMGIIQVHPEPALLGTDQSAHAHVRDQKRMLCGYVEYDWSNPGEVTARPKALSMKYFAPWDWIISATSYRNEFNTLFSVDELRTSMLSIRFGLTGYPYIIDSTGKVLLHPVLEGENIYDRRDADGMLLFQEIIKKKNGKLVYSWQNTGEPEPRRKIVFFNYIDQLDWIVASSGYIEELYAPLDVAQTSILLTMGLIIVLIIPFTWWFGGSITHPLSQIMERFSSGSASNACDRIELSGNDEIGKLATYYNRFMERLIESRSELERSEKEYREIFENSWEGILRTTPNGQIISCNPATAGMAGFETPQQMMAEVQNIGALYTDQERHESFSKDVAAKGYVRGFETELRRRDGRTIWVSLNSRSVVNHAGAFVAVQSFLYDITKQKEYETAQKEAQAILEKRVASRTAELSSRVNELKTLNAQGDLLRELGELLLVCRETTETFPIIRLYLEKLFPHSQVALFIWDEVREMLDLVLTTGEAAVSHESFVKEDCWALRKGKPHFSDPSGNHLTCPHLNGAGLTGANLCIPLMAQDELSGMLRLAAGNQDLHPTEGKSSIPGRETRRLSTLVAEHLALALTNIKLRETLRLQSVEDPLTGLYNRRYMMAFMDREMRRIRRTDAMTSIVMLDVDHFKRFNDAHGHDVGDLVLKKLAAYLKNSIRSTDLACRFGGEEFVLVMVDTPLGQCGQKAEKIRDEIEKSLVIHHGEVRLGVTVSMGVACALTAGETFEEVLQAADNALYKAKENGRNRVEMAPSRCIE